MQKLNKIKVGINKKHVLLPFEVNTNDMKSVKLLIEIYNGQSPLDLTDKTIRIVIRKPDNHIVFQDCTITDLENGQVEVVLENQAYVTPGTHTAEIMCYKGSEVVAVSGTFSYKSIKGIMNDEAVESKSEFTAITRTLGEAERILEDLKENGGGAGVDQQARQKIEEVTTLVENITQQIGEISAGGILTFSTIDDLKSAHPNGLNTPVWISADNSFYYWDGNSKVTVPTIASATAYAYSGKGGWKGSSFELKTDKELTDVFVYSEGSPKEWELWSAENNVMNSKVATGTLNTAATDDGYLTSPLQTPLSISAGTYILMVNYDAARGRSTDPSTGQGTLTENEFFKATGNFHSLTLPAVPAKGGKINTTNNYAYDAKFTFQQAGE